MSGRRPSAVGRLGARLRRVAFRAGAAALLVGAALGVAGPALSADRSIVPGLMGYNALPSLPNGDPRVDDDLQIELAAAAQLSDFQGRDASFTPYLKLVVPFRGVAAIEADVVTTEWWRVSPATQQRLGAARSSGVALGDIRFGARFAVLEEREALPAVGVRFVTKSTSGKSLEDRRFTSSPAYVLDALLAKSFPLRMGPFAGLRVLAKIGFMAWQQGSGWQDDAVDLGVTLQLRTPNGTRAELEWRGYRGYEAFDRPFLLGATLGHRVASAVEIVGTVNRGLTGDAPPWEIRLGVILRLDAWRGGRLGAAPERAPAAEAPPASGDVVPVEAHGEEGPSLGE